MFYIDSIPLSRMKWGGGQGHEESCKQDEMNGAQIKEENYPHELMVYLYLIFIQLHNVFLN